MSIPKKPKDVLLVLSILSSRWDEFWPALLLELEGIFGDVDYVSSMILFDETSYYDEELGTPIYRRFISFKKLVVPDRLPEIKLSTNRLEKRYQTDDGKRIFNLDPGILSFERFVLATGKEYTHRIYLKDGIWADLTLIFQKGRWQVLPWTYPDYAKKEIQDILLYLRNSYREKLRNKK
jgi:hypothetical protein